MNKELYFDRSRQEGCVLRCPYIGRCGRYVNTLYFLSGISKYSKQESVEDALIDQGLLDPGNLSNPIPVKGADFYEIGRENEHYYFDNGCPEVPLFDPVYQFIPKKAITSGSWDRDRIAGKYGADNKFRVDRTKHYTECAEYCSEKSLEINRSSTVSRNPKEFGDSDATMNGNDKPIKKRSVVPPSECLNITDDRTIIAIHEGLKGFFPQQDDELRKLLKGEKIKQKLHFPDNQNRLAEVFSRAYYHGKIAGTKKGVQDWLAANFTYKSMKEGRVTPLSVNTLKSIFNPTAKGEPPSGKRIVIEGLPWLPLSQRPRTGPE